MMISSPLLALLTNPSALETDEISPLHPFCFLLWPHIVADRALDSSEYCESIVLSHAASMQGCAWQWQMQELQVPLRNLSWTLLDPRWPSFCLSHIFLKTCQDFGAVNLSGSTIEIIHLHTGRSLPRKLWLSSQPAGIIHRWCRHDSKNNSLPDFAPFQNLQSPYVSSPTSTVLHIFLSECHWCAEMQCPRLLSAGWLCRKFLEGKCSLIIVGPAIPHPLCIQMLSTIISK